jgi:BON domain/CBS domain
MLSRKIRADLHSWRFSLLDQDKRIVREVRSNPGRRRRFSLIWSSVGESIYGLNAYGFTGSLVHGCDVNISAAVLGTLRRYVFLLPYTSTSRDSEPLVLKLGSYLGILRAHRRISKTSAPLGEIATLLQRYRIKRVPILRGGKLVGIVSRSNLIQALASSRTPAAAGSGADADRKIRSELLDRLGHQDWTDFGERNIIVNSGIVHLWGLVGSPEEHKALVALAEGVPGVVSVADEMIPAY